MTDMKELLQRALKSDGCERLQDFVSVGPAQMAAVELFADRLLAAIAPPWGAIMSQPYAFRLADELKHLHRDLPTWTEAVAELRRLHAQRDELLATLRYAVLLIETLTPIEGDIVRRARAVIVRAEGSQHE